MEREKNLIGFSQIVDIAFYKSGVTVNIVLAGYILTCEIILLFLYHSTEIGE